MYLVTIITGILLIVLGLLGYVGTGRVSMTALIPTFFGLALALLGLLAMKDGLRKHAMHGAAVLGLVGFLGGLVMTIMQAVKLASGKEIKIPALTEQAVMALICLAFVGLCVRSFIEARRSRAQKEPA